MHLYDCVMISTTKLYDFCTLNTIFQNFLPVVIYFDQHGVPVMNKDDNVDQSGDTLQRVSQVSDLCFMFGCCYRIDITSMPASCPRPRKLEFI